ncbi:cation:proton antiporter [Cellulomonas bogoriensis]|uniref:Cation:proton antiporter n=1 Tax=Cellulomonas bogoriensis 69B4 = DSM 16987 TaxID=1386082 RepID=A0A0A0C3D7_9CELL|nr:monovalent cation/H(+) antiporter subunit G [Cellulomonas bogoriensis]KGM13874.1 cation:proton antiporter [Cellulomonas bogoriensis 69B4 = DSM 16987]
MSDVLADIGTALVLLGVVVFAIGAVGLLRLPDVYARLSAVTMAGGLGVILMIIGVLLHQPTPMNTLKVALAIVIQLGTAAVGGTAMARAGYLTDAPRTPATRFDDLAASPAPVDGDHRTGTSQ